MDESMSEPMPAIVPTTQNRFFWAGAREGRLLVQRCEDCGRYRHPPMPLCAACQSPRVEAVAVSGRGRVYSCTTVRRVFHPGFAARVPYVIALVELRERANLFMVSNIVGCAPEAVRIGAEVMVEFQSHGDWILPVFRLVATPEVAT